jgi:HK97 family phage major capsid protein/HK97 family phage prohead protease
MDRPPRDNIVRAVFPGVEVRDDEGAPTLFGHFARFNEWTRIDSVYEGTFMERVAPGSFAKTFSEGGRRARITLNHGQDPDLGDKPIAAPRSLREDDQGAYYEADLLDGVPPLLVSGLRAGQYGASFRFRVTREDFDRRPKASDHNPDAIPERTIREVELYEYGPVTYPAYQNATASVRSLTDDYIRHIVPDAPSVDAGAEPHLEPERRDDPDPPPDAASIEDQDPPDGGSFDSRSKSVDKKEYPTREEKVARVNELKASLRTIDEESDGELEPAVQARWDADSAEIDELERDIRAIDARKARLGVLADRPENTEIEAPGFIVRKSESDIYDVETLKRSTRSRDEYAAKVRDNALRAVEITRWPNVRADHKEAAGRIGQFIEYQDHPINGDGPDGSLAERMLALGSPAYRHAFQRYLASGGQERGTALAVGVDGTGGFSVPVAFDPTVIAIGAWTAINPYRAVCRVVTITGTDTWQALTSTAVPAVYAAEAAAATEQGPTFARPEFIVKRAHSFVTASYEMAQDRSDLAAELSVLFGEGKDTNEETQFTIGVGTTVFPQGAGLKDAYTRVDSVTNDTVAVADVRAVEAALPIRHRMNAVWFLSRAAIRAIQAFETTGGQLFNGVNYAAVGNPQSNAGGNTGLTLLGYPVYENPSMPWTPTTDDTTWGLLFNPQTYVIVDRVGMSVRVIPDMLNGATPSFPTGEIGIYAFWRNTARVLNADGGRQGAVQ